MPHATCSASAALRAPRAPGSGEYTPALRRKEKKSGFRKKDTRAPNNSFPSPLFSFSFLGAVFILQNSKGLRGQRRSLTSTHESLSLRHAWHLSRRPPGQPRKVPSAGLSVCHSHTMLFVGQAGSGKTNLMVSILSQHKKKGKRCGMAKVIIVFAILKK